MMPYCPSSIHKTKKAPAYWDNILEPIVASHYSKRTGQRVRRINAVLQHPDPQLQWMLANIDREVTGASDVQILECKTAGINGARLWKEGVPEYVQLQVMHQLAVTGKQSADACRGSDGIACVLYFRQLAAPQTEINTVSYQSKVGGLGAAYSLNAFFFGSPKQTNSKILVLISDHETASLCVSKPWCRVRLPTCDVLTQFEYNTFLRVQSRLRTKDNNCICIQQENHRVSNWSNPPVRGKL